MRRHNNHSRKLKRKRNQASRRQLLLNDIRYWILFNAMAKFLAPQVAKDVDRLIIDDLLPANPDHNAHVIAFRAQHHPKWFSCQTYVDGKPWDEDPPPPPLKRLAHVPPKVRHV
jgi:hypothetical protein